MSAANPAFLDQGSTNQLNRQSDRSAQAASIGTSSACEVQCGAVVDRSSHPGQTKGDIDGMTESGMFENRKSLVVVHGQNGVVVRKMAWHEGRICGQRADQVEAFTVEWSTTTLVNRTGGRGGTRGAADG